MKIENQYALRVLKHAVRASTNTFDRAYALNDLELIQALEAAGDPAWDHHTNSDLCAGLDHCTVERRIAQLLANEKFVRICRQTTCSAEVSISVGFDKDGPWFRECWNGNEGDRERFPDWGESNGW